MQRVIVIGCPGSGKSTFSRALHDATGLPLYHLDRMYWSADGTEVPYSIFMEQLRRAMEAESWILDGNYAATMELRMQRCDTVFFLDYPLEVCMDGIQSRRGAARTDMPCVLPEDDPEFLEFVKCFHSESRPAILALLRKYTRKRIVIFQDRSEASAFLSAIKQ